MAAAKSLTRVAVVVTVYNEQETITDLLTALKHQTFSPSEVVIVDGGSTDQTWETLLSWAKKWPILKVFQLPKANRSVGRNYGVSRTKSTLIAFTDAGCTPRPDWLAELIQPFSDPGVEIVSGYYTGRSTNAFQASLVPFVLVMPDRAGQTEFFPATRSMGLTRSAWDKSGGFDPLLYYNEDYAFAHWLKKIGFAFYFAPRAIVEWWPRKNLWAAAKMFFFFSLGDVQAKIFRPKVKLLFIRYLIFIYLLLLSFENRFFFSLVIPTTVVYLTWSVNKNYRYVKKLPAFFWLPVIQLTADLAIIWGTLIGLMSRVYGLS